MNNVLAKKENANTSRLTRPNGWFDQVKGGSTPNSSLTDRTVVISGGSRGIGLAIGIGAARLGADVVLLAKTDTPHPRLPGTVHTAAAEVEAAGGKALAVVGDVRREEDVQRVVDAAVQRFGGVDICVNNASAIAVEPTAVLSAKKFDLMQEINLRGTFLLTKACVPHLQKSANPARADHLAAGQHEPALAGRPPRLHAVQVRNDVVVTGLGGRVRRGRDRGELPLAGDLYRYGRGGKHGRWR